MKNVVNIDKLPIVGTSIWNTSIGKGTIEWAKIWSYKEMGLLVRHSPEWLVFEDVEDNDRNWNGGGQWGDCFIAIKAACPDFSSNPVYMMITSEWFDSVAIMNLTAKHTERVSKSTTWWWFE